MRTARRRRRRNLTNKEAGPPGGKQGSPSDRDSLPKPKPAPPRSMGERKPNAEEDKLPGEKPPSSREDSKAPPAQLNGKPFGLPGGSFNPNNAVAPENSDAAGDPQNASQSPPFSMTPGSGGQSSSSYQSLGATGLAVMTATFSALVLPQAPVTPSLIGIIICYIPPFPCNAE